MLATIVSQFSLNFVHKENEKEMSLSAVWRVRSSERSRQSQCFGGHRHRAPWVPQSHGLARPMRPDPGPGRANSGGKEATIDVQVSGWAENHKAVDGGDEAKSHINTKKEKRQTSLN